MNSTPFTVKSYHLESGCFLACPLTVVPTWLFSRVQASFHSIACPLSPSMQPTLVLSLGSDLWSSVWHQCLPFQSLAVSQTGKCWVAITICADLCCVLKAIPALSSEALNLPLCPAWSPCQVSGISSVETFLLSQFLSGSWVLSQLLFLFLFLFSFALLSYVDIFLPLWKSEVFCLCFVAVIWELFHM